MGGISNYWRTKMLSHSMGKEVYVAPTYYYVALSSTNPLATGLGITEPVGGSYVRTSTQAVNWSDVSSYQIQNVSVVTFVKATGAWGTMAYFALFDAQTNGNMLAFGQLFTPVSVIINNTPGFPAGTLVIGH